MSKTLNLTLKKKWFDLISSGIKTEEYREIKDYWKQRLIVGLLGQHWGEGEYIFKPKQFDSIIATNGYGKHRPSIQWDHKGIRIGEGKKEWGAIPGTKYFILEIGEVISNGV
jgi:hypothetical protein